MGGIATHGANPNNANEKHPKERKRGGEAVLDGDWFGTIKNGRTYQYFLQKKVCNRRQRRDGERQQGHGNKQGASGNGPRGKGTVRVP